MKHMYGGNREGAGISNIHYGPVADSAQRAVSARCAGGIAMAEGGRVAIVRMRSAGNIAPSTCKTTLFQSAPLRGYDPHGAGIADVDSHGRWFGPVSRPPRHLASFDVRSKVQGPFGRPEEAGESRWQPVQGRLDAL